jgi:hypothetical protein
MTFNALNTSKSRCTAVHDAGEEQVARSNGEEEVNARMSNPKPWLSEGIHIHNPRVYIQRTRNPEPTFLAMIRMSFINATRGVLVATL